MKTITSRDTTEKIRETFADFGIPKTLTADNAPTFTSEEFKQFCLENGIELLHTIPYMPSMNGEVERQNRSLLKVLTISQNDKSN